jgi:hypothetical protein
MPDKIDWVATGTLGSYHTLTDLFRVVREKKPHVNPRAVYGLPDL